MVNIQSVRSTTPGGYEVNTPGRQLVVFLDRDGVLDATDVFINTVEQFKAAVYPGAAEAIARLSNETNARVIITTNQGGIDAGKMSEQVNHDIQQATLDVIEAAGGRLDALYFCPNGHKFQVPEGQISGRKPDGGMIVQAAKDFGPGIDLQDGYMIGDMTTDIASGKAAYPNITTVLLETGFGGKDGKVDIKPDTVQKDIGAAVEWIIQREKSLK